GLRPPPQPRRVRWPRGDEHPLDIRDGHQLRPTAHRATVRTVDRVARQLAALIVDPGDRGG
ncbi:hypothetical protein, partial [Agrococcus sp. HG114]|uniref:hypothetical protein n=1 Tax=Agrococcus sp. HG114 TaxID=2969757 RepID=UPI00215AA949